MATGQSYNITTVLKSRDEVADNVYCASAHHQTTNMQIRFNY